MSDLAKRIAALSPQQRALLELRLKQKGLKAPSLNTISPRKTSDSLPLSVAQERLWLLHQLQPDIPLYNESSLFRLHGKLNITVLEKSISTLIERHESLRSHFTLQGEKPIQVIDSPQPFKLSIINLETIPESQHNEIIQTQASLPFDLSQGYLLRGILFQINPKESILLFIMHHIISDGWSWKIFYQELATLYTAYLKEESPTLPQLPIQYADFALWQREWLESETIQTQLNYWKTRLADIPPILNLPTDSPRPAIQRFRGAREPVILSQQLSDAIQSLSQQLGVTPFMTLLAAFKTLLYRYTAQTDIAIGIPVANRNRQEIEGLIGCFINTLVLRSQLSGEISFQDFLKQIRETTLAAYANADIPFEQLVKELQPERVMSHTPLFQAMLVYQDAPSQGLTLPNVTIQPLVPDNGISKFDLTLFLENTTQGLMGALEYNTDIFKSTTIQRLLGHFQTLLEAIVKNPNQSLATLPLLTPSESERFQAWNATQVDYPSDCCLHTLIEAQVEKTPDAIAVVYDNPAVETRHGASLPLPTDDASVRYAELNAKANQLAHYLQELGVKPDGLVGVCLDRSLEMIIALLGILKAGGAYVPLDPTYPPQRLAFMVKDAQVPIILTQQKWLDTLPESTANVICLDSDWDKICSASSENPNSSVTAENLAYTIYTSGSTGNPKGAMNTHQAIVNRLLWMRDAYGVGECDRILQKTPFSFDVSVWEFFLPLISGGTLVVARPEGHKDAVYLRNAIARHGITMLHFVPSMLQVFLLTTEDTEDAEEFILNSVNEGGEKEDQLVSLLFSPLPLGEGPGVRGFNLKRVICSGEALSVDLQNRFFEDFPGVELHNLYGPTEAAIDVTAWQCWREENQYTVPIGKAIANIQLYILDSSLQQVPVGIPGELHIGGIGLARGYLHRPDLTAQKFIPNPFNPSQRLYKTGDLCRYRDDGVIEYLGRIDYQVKLRGFRIELGEIEAIISQFAEVREAVVILHQEEANNSYLVAYVVPQQEEINLQALRQFLQEKLPDYMIPSLFMELEGLPLTSNGKVNRKALPSPNKNRLSEKGFVSPKTPIEAILANIWGRILGLTQVGIEDNFFELGGHSLLATQVMSQLRQAFSIELPLGDLFENPTIAELAKKVETGLNANSLEYFAIQPIARDASIPLSFAQQRLWFLQELDPQSAAYNGCVAVDIRGKLNVTALEQSLNRIVERHEILRTQFKVFNGQPTQEIVGELNLPLPLVDLRGVSTLEQEKEADKIAIADAQKPFNLNAAPLLRVTLIQFEEENYRLLLTIHHIIFDAWSTAILIREIAATYEALIQNQTLSLPPLPVQYADFAAWQREWLEREELQQQLDYWKKQLLPIPPVLQLPTNPVSETGNAGKRYAFSLSKSLADSLNRLSQRSNTTLFMTLLAAFKVLLHYYTQQKDIVVGSPIANRNRQEIEGLIGFFVNTLALRTNLSQAETFADVLQQVREVTLGAYSHQDLPFEKLVAELDIDRNLESFPLFRVWFVLQNTPKESLTLPELTLSLSDLETGFVRHDLKLDLTETSEGISGFFEYKTALFDANFISRMATLWTQLLMKVGEQPTICLESLLNQLAETEKQQQQEITEAVKSSRRQKLTQMRRKSINS
ncbi:MAG: condensation domain-containing protein [Chroococcales cyanobacterium]